MVFESGCNVILETNIREMDPGTRLPSGEEKTIRSQHHFKLAGRKMVSFRTLSEAKDWLVREGS